MNLRKHQSSGSQKVELQIAPLIDVVFLLLIYFMVTASLIKKEGDISFVLPVNIPSQDMVSIPVEIQIEIASDGAVMSEGLSFSSSDRQLDDLTHQLAELRQVAKMQQSPFLVTLVPNRDALHDRIIDVMDACAAAGVQNLSFGKSI